MNPFWLELNGQRYSEEELTNPHGEYEALTDFEKSTLLFCHDWLTGKKTFTLTTSGSTGSPKPILLRRQQMEASARLTIDALQLKAGDHALVCLNTRYIAGQMMLVRSFLAGMNIIAVEPAANPFHSVTKLHIDFAAFVPFQVEAILAEGFSTELDTLKCSIIGGAPLSESLRRTLKEIKSPLFATYGMTETLSHIALQKLNGANPQDCFHVLGNTKISKDDRGCLVIHADYLDEAVTTNDLVNIIDPSHFMWLGRMDNIINSGGIKISPEPVEKVVELIFEEENLTNRFFVAGVADPKLGQRVVLFIEGNNFGDEARDRVLHQVALRVSKFEIPKEIRFVAAFSETESGKINRRETMKRSETREV